VLVLLIAVSAWLLVGLFVFATVLFVGWRISRRDQGPPFATRSLRLGRPFRLSSATGGGNPPRLSGIPHAGR
jgi:hypothetical protein